MPGKLTPEEKKARKAAQAARYLKQIGRQAQKDVEPNDRHYDREFHQKVRRMPPTEFDELINGED